MCYLIWTPRFGIKRQPYRATILYQPTSGKQPVLVLQVLTDFPIKKYSIEMKSSWVLILSLGLITVLSVSKAKPFGEELIPRDIGDAIEFDDGWLTKKKGEFFFK